MKLLKGVLPATVFNLRHGVKFWDGNEMTSADVHAARARHGLL